MGTLTAKLSRCVSRNGNNVLSCGLARPRIRWYPGDRYLLIRLASCALDSSLKFPHGHPHDDAHTRDPAEPPPTVVSSARWPVRTLASTRASAVLTFAGCNAVGYPRPWRRAGLLASRWSLHEADSPGGFRIRVTSSARQPKLKLCWRSAFAAWSFSHWRLNDFVTPSRFFEP